MSEPKWTPGPWSVDVLMHSDPNGDDYPSAVEVGSDSGLHICGHDLGYNDDVDIAIIANAHLIAAAPDMAEALKAAIAISDRNVGDGGRTDECQQVYDQCAAALAKARGEA